MGRFPELFILCCFKSFRSFIFIFLVSCEFLMPSTRGSCLALVSLNRLSIFFYVSLNSSCIYHTGFLGLLSGLFSGLYSAVYGIWMIFYKSLPTFGFSPIFWKTSFVILGVINVSDYFTGSSNWMFVWTISWFST